MTQSKEKRVESILLSPRSIPSLSPDAGLHEVIELILLSHNEVEKPDLFLITGINGPEGIVGITEILEAVRPGGLKDNYYRGWSFTGYWSSPAYVSELFAQKCKALSEVKVKEIMRPITYDLGPRDTLSRVVDVFYKKNTHWLTVGEKGSLLGVISLDEVLKQMRAIIGNKTIGSTALSSTTMPDNRNRPPSCPKVYLKAGF